MNKLKIAYFGTPQFSADLLEKIILSDLPVEIKLVVTQPDKPIGREQNLTASPVKTIALKYGIPVYDGSDIDQLPQIIKDNQIDLGLLYSFGFKQWLSKDLLSSPLLKFGDTGFGFLNIHPSLLPLYRGASPIVFPILLGDKQTGVSLMVMDEKMDHGPLLAQEKIDIETNDTSETLTKRLTNLAFDLIVPVIKQLTASESNSAGANAAEAKNKKQLTITPQIHTRATFARYLTRDDGFIPLDLIKKALRGETIEEIELPKIYQWYVDRPPSSVLRHPSSVLRHPSSVIRPPSSATYIIDRMFRALSPWPGLWTTVTVNGQQKRLILKQVAINNKQLLITRIQLEGKNEVDFESFIKAFSVF